MQILILTTSKYSHLPAAKMRRKFSEQSARFEVCQRIGLAAHFSQFCAAVNLRRYGKHVVVAQSGHVHDFPCVKNRELA